MASNFPPTPPPQLPPGAFAPRTGVMPAVAPMVPSVGGILSMEGNNTIEARRAAAQAANTQPIIQNLAGHVRRMWDYARDAKRQDVEQRMLRSLRQRRGEYDPETLSQIKQGGGSEIYMQLTSNKCRSAAAWIRDVMLGAGEDKPWTIKPTPESDLPPQVKASVINVAAQEANAFTQATGLPVGPEYIARDAAVLYDRTKALAKKQADERMSRMEVKMEDQLVEGHFHKGLSEFINDIVTFPAAVLKGPIVKKKRVLTWEGEQPTANEQLVLEWARVDPFMVYPAPYASNVNDGDFIERHKLTRQALNEMKGVEGYNNDAIDAVLEQYGRGGLSDWLDIDSAKAAAEGKSTAAVGQNPGGLIDALQYWGSVQGKLLVEWGMKKEEVADELKEYHCEVWLIGTWCIKAMINPDALGRIPYYRACYEEVPGSFWGNAVPDLCCDAQTQCNAAARAIANNMGIASGPQVTYNIDRLPPGQDLTQMYPWKVHQHTSDPYGSTTKAVDFFAPPLIANELMVIYRFFSEMADEHTGIPRYMTGDATAQGGALRTSSGMSMLMQNAGKSIKQVIANIDTNAIEPLITRLWYYNMVYGKDPELKGDISVVARGAASLIVKETQQQRINEFLQLALTNPLVNQIVGEEAIAAMLRIAAKNLDMDVDEIVPRPEIIRARVAAATQAAQEQQKQAQEFAIAMATAPSQEMKVERGPDGEVVGMTVIDKQQHVLQDPGQPPLQPGLTPAPGANTAKTVTGSGQPVAGMGMAVDSFSPPRTH